MRRYDAILFDFDGVLIDSEPLHFACWRDLTKPLGIDLDWPTYTSRLRGHSGNGLIEMLRQLTDPPLPFDDVYAIYPAKNDLFRERAMVTDVMSAEVKQLLSTLEAYKLAIVSSARQVHVDAILERAQARHHFHAIVCRDHVTRVKPAPDPYLLGAERTGATRPLVVEDSEAGCEAGRQAGFDVLFIPEYAQMPALLREALER